ncbi:hypothetical protein KAR48_13260, partial [bacterium]|nr:hypothetical protein [bacterium]
MHIALHVKYLVAGHAAFFAQSSQRTQRRTKEGTTKKKEYTKKELMLMHEHINILILFIPSCFSLCEL